MTTTFMNPLLNAGPDPWMYKHTDGFYYFTSTTHRRIELRKSTAMTGLASAPIKKIWTTPEEGPYSHNVWAPEIHFIGQKWYVYFTANDGGGDDTRRVYVLENSSADPTEGEWTLKGSLDTEHPGLDGTVLQHRDELYFLYAGYGHFPDYGSAIYIVRMENPWTLTGSNVLLTAPTYDWEKQGGMAINEGPVFLKRNGRLFLIFSASTTWSDGYCLGMLTAEESADLLDPSSWVKHPEPVFKKSAANRVFAPGHNSFTSSPDGSEDWIVYHAISYSESEGTHGAAHRTVRIQKFGWNPDGTPDLGVPLPAYMPIAKPAGEC